MDDFVDRNDFSDDEVVVVEKAPPPVKVGDRILGEMPHRSDELKETKAMETCYGFPKFVVKSLLREGNAYAAMDPQEFFDEHVPVSLKRSVNPPFFDEWTKKTKDVCLLCEKLISIRRDDTPGGVKSFKMCGNDELDSLVLSIMRKFHTSGLSKLSKSICFLTPFFDRHQPQNA